MRIRKSTIRAVGIIGILAILVVAVGIVMAAGGASIATTPLRVQESVYRDLDFDGVHDPEELIGVFDVYDGNQPIDFSWTAYPFSSGVNGSYRVSLIQNTTPLEDNATWSEVVIGHHWASNSNGTNYVMGPFDHNTVCTDCPSHFLIVPETYVQVYNAAADRYDYEYTPVAAALGGAVASNLEESDDFIIEIFYVAPEETCKGGSPNCVQACQSYDQCVSSCKAAPGCNVNTACLGPTQCLAACSNGEFNKCGGGGGGDACFDAWLIFCDLTTGNLDEYYTCVSNYASLAGPDWCESCIPNPSACAD